MARSFHRAISRTIAVLAPMTAIAGASTPYSPTWQIRHQLQLLVDHGGLALPTSHWPLPSAAVRQALDQLPSNLPTIGVDLEGARRAVLRDLQNVRESAQVSLQLRTRKEGLTGFGENYTPGTNVSGVSQDIEGQWGELSVAGRLGARIDTQQTFELAGPSTVVRTSESQRLRLEGSAMVVGMGGWNFQAFSHRSWWGPGWQSSLVNGSNSPAWQGIGIQRATAGAADHPWLRWMGPWNFDLFVSRTEDVSLAYGQPMGALFSGMRLTIQPKPWLEIGLSRGLQTGGTGRPSGLKSFVKAFFGQEVNKNPGDSFEDSSSQIAGYDIRVRCPKAMGSCAVYSQWMGEDAAGKIPLPFKFMSLWGAEATVSDGRHRLFIEHANTNIYSLPWDTKPESPGYVNGAYPQGYTHAARWIGSAQGTGSKVTTMGWLDASSNTAVKLHRGTILERMGSRQPLQVLSAGQLTGLSVERSVAWVGYNWTPEVFWALLKSRGTGQPETSRTVRLGLTIANAR